MTRLSSLRARLASFDHAYLLAIRLSERSDQELFVVRTGNPIQPYRVTARPPANDEQMVLRVA
ncbi:hypothetical protein GCM10007897_24250 [Sphingobium jiangsuense]|uniref:Uncharacterized protein n=1 Tax=Sphingobium jiangsuense TaxID=870476 RepID=A0A7W6BR92_9SPHN|nr:hypothetical protein [Sphingobium jiangsuense]MBB3928600.1 hypothetical protein [Sphingobium jiangsuense]GLT01034.1 hypothetical protein GCM10007897_24250 [Sphingobium jiangsuense]